MDHDHIVYPFSGKVRRHDSLVGGFNYFLEVSQIENRGNGNDPIGLAHIFQMGGDYPPSSPQIAGMDLETCHRIGLWRCQLEKGVMVTTGVLLISL